MALKYWNGTAFVDLKGDPGNPGSNAPPSNLTTTRTGTDVTVVSDTGTDAAIPAADATLAGVMTAADRTKLTGIAAAATANDTDANLKARSNHTGTQSADSLTDGTTNKAFLATERTKLAGIATSATANATDAQLRDRATHTGSQTSLTISDFTEAVQDAVAVLLAAGTGVTLAYDDAANSLTITGTAGGGGGLDAEAVRDAIGIALIGSGLIAVAVNDAADTITITTTATANSTDAALRDRTTHTGVQAVATVTGLQEALDGKNQQMNVGSVTTFTLMTNPKRLNFRQGMNAFDNGGGEVQIRPDWGGTGVAETVSRSDHTHAAAAIVSGVVAPARLGTGTPDATTVLYGDGTFKTAPVGGGGGSGLASGVLEFTLAKEPTVISVNPVNTWVEASQIPITLPTGTWELAIVGTVVVNRSTVGRPVGIRVSVDGAVSASRASTVATTDAIATAVTGSVADVAAGGHTILLEYSNQYTSAHTVYGRESLLVIRAYRRA